MPDLDLQALTEWAGTAWLILMGLVALLLGVLTLLLPYFVWQISRWTRAAARESARLNDQMEQLLTLLSARAHPALPEPQAQFSFQCGPPAPSVEERDAGDTAAAEEPRAASGRQAPEAAPEGEEAKSPSVSVPRAEGARQALLLPSDPRRPEVTLARCGWCDHKLSYRQPMSGRKVRCPSCSRPLELP